MGNEKKKIGYYKISSDMEYTIVHDSGANEVKVIERIREIVNAMTKEGWKPQGGISITRLGLVLIDFAQAMIRD